MTLYQTFGTLFFIPNVWYTNCREAIKDKVAGVSCGCADVFGAKSDVVISGFDLIKDNAVPGTTGLPSLRNLIADGYQVVTF